MGKDIDNFQRAVEDAIGKAIRREGFSVNSRKIEVLGPGEVDLFLRIENMEVLIGCVDLEFSRDDLLRSLERYEGMDEQKVIRDFCESLIWHLKHPDHKEPSLLTLKGLYWWVMGKVFWAVPYPDVPDKEHRKSHSASPSSCRFFELFPSPCHDS